jgi:Fe-S-cluster-containing dehydrogenase component
VAMNRRAALKGMVVAGATIAGVTPARAAVRREAPADAVGLLYDATLCIGCKACVGACAKANNLTPDPGSSNGLYQAPIDLNARTKNIIKMYSEGTDRSYMKVQCMHCVDPACASACMLGALKKRELGIVSYDVSLCVGCRYCEMACPYNVPKFEWSRLNPRIVKCELCRDRIAAGGIPACVEVCPRKAVIYGRRADLLEEAKRRIAEGGGKYVPKVYGETDGGGTQALYLSHIAFEKLGLPNLGPEAVATRARTVQHAVDKYFITPTVLYAVLSAATFRNRKAADWRKPPEEQQP